MCRKIPRLFTLFVFIIIVVASPRTLSGAEKTAQNTITTIELNKEGSYHWGDFERDEQGRPVGVRDEAAWKTPQPPEYIMEGQKSWRPNHWLWYRQQLPEILGPNAAIWFPPYNSYQSFDVYLDDRIIYRAGQSGSSFRLRHLYLKWHLFLLPPDSSGRAFFFDSTLAITPAIFMG